jgi:pimeloyl-ACP methyl ester carboxylesterase
MKRTSASIGAILATLVGTPHAAATAVPCRAGKSQCMRVIVPLDRGAGTATVALHVQRVKATARGAGTLIVLPGGPGQSASVELRELLEALGPHIRKRWNVVIFDPRGTGRSGPLLCPLLQDDPLLRSTLGAAECARRLEASRSHYTTWNTVQDLEAVRVSLGVDRVALLGASYGTRVEMGYAAAYAKHVDRVVLDSVVAPEGPSSVALESFAAMRRILASFCPKRCHGVTQDLVAETRKLVRLLRLGPLAGLVFDAEGKARRRTIDALGLLDLLFAADLLPPAIRGGMAAAITSARRKDPAALLRLATVAKIVRLKQPPEFSAGVYAATTCAEFRPPWDPAADRSARPAQVKARFSVMSDAAFEPFDRQTALAGGLVPLCLAWPTPTPKPTAVPWRSIAAPTFFLAGTHDVRAPVETLRRIVAQVPKASVLRVPSAGHSVFGRDAPQGCARQAVRAFLLAARRIRRCGRVGLPTPVGIPPTAFADLRPTAPLRGRPGRTLRAVELTLGDVAFALQLASRGGGLRGGSFIRGTHGPRLRSVEYVPGVRVSASKSNQGAPLQLRISGRAASRGILTLARNGRVRGRLGARSISGRLKVRTDDLQ